MKHGTTLKSLLTHERTSVTSVWSLLSLQRNAPSQFFRAERPAFGDECSRRVHLSPDVPEEHAADAAVRELVDDALAEGRPPVGERLETGIEATHRLVPKLEQV